MKIISTVYECDYCNHSSHDLDEIVKHENFCMYNPDNTEAKMSLIQKMKESATLKELNDLLESAITSNIIPEPENKMIYSFHGSEQNYYFCINRYTLTNPYSAYFERGYGISMNLEDYPKLFALVQEMKEINKTSSKYNSDFNTHAKKELKKIKQESVEYIDAKQNLDTLIEEIKVLERKRLELNIIHDNIIKSIDDKIKDDYGYVNPNIRLNEIKESLK